MNPGIAAVGMCAWDHFLVCKRYPGPGEYTIIEHEFEQAGGTTANTCAALGLLGLNPALASTVGDDETGDAIIASLSAAGCDIQYIRKKREVPTDRSVIVISGEGDAVDRTIFWIQGARPVAGERFPVAPILDHRWVLLDVDDPELRQFWLDLPAHLSPRTRLIGTMIYLVDMEPAAGWAQALQHDVIFGNRREFLRLTGAEDLEAAIERAREDMPGTACGLMLVSLGARGSLAIRPRGVTHVPAFQIEAVDTTGAGDAFAAGCIWGLLENQPDDEILRRGNLIGGLACTAFGARAGLPTLTQAHEAFQRLSPRCDDA